MDPTYKSEDSKRHHFHLFSTSTSNDFECWYHNGTSKVVASLAEFGQGVIAHRASRGEAPTAPRSRPRAPRLGRKPKPKARQSVAPVPLLPPLSDGVWKPTPVAAEEVLQAAEVNAQSRLQDVAAEAWQLIWNGA